jgi:hypothetical protein
MAEQKRSHQTVWYDAMHGKTSTFPEGAGTCGCSSPAEVSCSCPRLSRCRAREQDRFYLRLGLTQSLTGSRWSPIQPCRRWGPARLSAADWVSPEPSRWLAAVHRQGLIQTSVVAGATRQSAQAGGRGGGTARARRVRATSPVRAPPQGGAGLPADAPLNSHHGRRQQLTRTSEAHRRSAQKHEDGGEANDIARSSEARGDAARARSGWRAAARHSP